MVCGLLEPSGDGTIGSQRRVDTLQRFTQGVVRPREGILGWSFEGKIVLLQRGNMGNLWI